MAEDSSKFLMFILALQNSLKMRHITDSLAPITETPKNFDEKNEEKNPVAFHEASKGNLCLLFRSDGSHNGSYYMVYIIRGL